MIVNFFNKIYVDTNIPDLVPGTSGEHLAEFYTACSRGSRLNKNVVLVVPDKPLNRKVYDILPEEVNLNIVECKSFGGLKARIIIWVVSGYLIERPKKHIYSYFRVRINQFTDKTNKSVVRNIICNILVPLKKHINDQFFNKRQYLDKKEVSTGVACKLRNIDIKISQEYLDEVGVDYSKKFICLHLRDHISDSDGYNRECSIEKFESGIKYLESKGIFVIKIGRESKVKYVGNNVIDLSFDDMPHVVQIYLISICEFVISYQTGVIPFLSYMFNKPLLMLNVVDPVMYYPIKRNALIVLKTLYYKGTIKEANFDDITSGKIIGLNKAHDFDKFYYYKENSDDEVLLSVKEMIDFIDTDFKKDNNQIFLERYLQEKNIDILKNKKEVGVYNRHMRWSGVDFIGAGALCPWCAKKIRSEIESYSN